MSHLREFEELLKAKCSQNEPPFCTADCPFQLDVKDLVKKWRKGRFNAAYRTFANAVAFPEIVAAGCDHPCGNRCPRKDRDGAVDLHGLEQAMVKYATRKKPNVYNMPAKDGKVAIVGAGVSGLACALSLCNKKYTVTVFEKTDRLGGRLWGEMEPKLFLTDIADQFRHETCDLKLNTEVCDLAELSGYDAIYVATGAGGRDFGLVPSGEGAFASTRKGVFFGGSLCGRGTMEAMADGTLASHAVERYLKTVLMNQPDERIKTHLRIDPAMLPAAAPVTPADGLCYTEEEAAREAERCVLCSCDACMRQCDLMQMFNDTPRGIYEEVAITIMPGTIAHDGTCATRLISTCNQCGLCKTVCPQSIDVGEFFLQSHQAMVKKGSMPWVFHDYWLRDMAFSDGEAALYLPGPDCGEKPRYVFFPGCQMGASEPEYVKKSFAWLLEQCSDTALWLRCCGAPAEWAGDTALHGESISAIRGQWEALGRPELIFGCPTCRKMFAKHLPEIPGRFLYEHMAAAGLRGAARDLPGETCSVFDPCASRDFPALQESVRTLTRDLDLSLEPLGHEGKLAQCCSYGGQVSIASPVYARQVAEERVNDRDTTYIAYCVNCRDVFAGQNKPVYHILDLVFGLHGPGRPMPNLTRRWTNRRELKYDLLMTYSGKTADRRVTMKLHMDDALREKLSREMILETDMEEVIRCCEDNGRKLLDPVTGHFIGHRKLQNMTYWAEYLPEGDGYRLFGGYAHRMCLEVEK